MDRYDSNFLSFRRGAIIFLSGLSLVIFGAFYFFNVSAQTEAREKPAEQNLLLGKLAFTSRKAGPTSPDGRIFIANPDASGATALGIPLSLNPTEPAWSPDGTRIAWNGRQNQNDIFVINTDGSGQTNLTNTAEPIQESNPAWSVTGKIAYERSGQIWTMNADGSGQAQFTGITQFGSADPAWSPDGTKLAYVSESVIWVINADGTNPHQVTTGGTPAWSPDGSKIAFRGGAGISTINADGTNVTPLTTGLDSTPAWSPDGTKIAYRGSSGVWTMDANGANQVRIVTDQIQFPLCCDTHYENPAWQPVAQTPNTFNINGRITHSNLPMSGVTVNLNGTTKAAATTDAVGNYQFSGLPAGGNYTVSPSFPRYYFTPPNRSFNNLTSNQLGQNFEVLGICQGGNCVKNGKIGFVRNNDIFTINADGTTESNITNNAAIDTEPNFAPDGSMIFSTNRDGNYEIYRMNALDDPNPANLTNNAGSDSNPYYSTDGKSIVFASDRDGNLEIYKMKADGSNQVRLTNNTTPDGNPAFSPDGNKIIFIAYSSTQGVPMKIYTMNADGSNQQQLPAPGGFSPNYSWLSYSPDGTKIMFTYSQDLSTQIRTTWTMNAADGSNPAAFPASGSFGTYSPDGAKVAYTCCLFDNTNRLRTSDAAGSSGSIKTLTPSITGNSLPDWQPLAAPRPAQFDFDGDGRSDVSVFRASNGAWYILRSREGLWVPVWGISTDVPVPADYDGDLKTDVAIWRGSSGDFYVLNSFDATVRIENFGLLGDIPTGGDFDGDGKAEVAVYREGAQGVFYYRASMGNPNSNITFIPWGITDDKPVAGDYDGDGRTDAAVFRPSNGTWYVRKSSDAQLLAANWGLANDKLVPADYDADGKTDFAVFRDGTWYLLRSTQGFTALQFGINNDVPAPADYDGDGKADVTIYREGVWWILKSQSGQAEAVQFGIGSDKPVPSAYLR